jgi:hypothetical protein
MAAVWLKSSKGHFVRADDLAEVWVESCERGLESLLVRERGGDAGTEIVVTEAASAGATDPEPHLAAFPGRPAGDHLGSESLLVRAATAAPAARTPPLPSDFAERLVHLIAQCGSHHAGSVISAEPDGDTWTWKVDTAVVSH